MGRLSTLKLQIAGLVPVPAGIREKVVTWHSLKKTDNASGPKPGDDASIEPVIKLLTLSNIELSAFVEAEIEKNPVLEAAPSQPLTDRTGQSDHPTVETIGELTNQTELETSAKSLSENLGTSLENVYPDEQDYRSPATDNAKTKEEYDSRISTGGLQLSSAVSAHDQTVADYTAARETLQDTLMGQLAISGTSITHSKIATDIIDNLDPAGYQRPFAASAGVSGALHRPEMRPAA